MDADGNYIGFDAIIGNPPYIRIQGIKEFTPLLADAYKTIYESATGSYDIYALFVEKSLSLIRRKGVINFIMPTKWTNAAFGKGLRSVIVRDNTISKMINFGSFQVFDASTYTGLQWFEIGSDNLKYVELEENSVKVGDSLDHYLTGIKDTDFNNISANTLSDEPWVLSDGSIMSILDKLNTQPRRLSDIFSKIFQGLATSRDDVYFLYECQEKEGYIEGYSKELAKIIKIEVGLVKPLLKGEDVHRYEKILSDRVVIFPYKIEASEARLYSEDELAQYFPLGYTYLKECEPILRGREKGRFNVDGEWFQFGRKQGMNFAECEKLVAPEISKGGNFSYDKKGEFYSTTTVYGYIKNKEIAESYKCLMAILNSQLLWWYLVNTGTILANGYFRFNTNYLKSFPMPPSISNVTMKKLESLVDEVLKKKTDDSKSDCVSLENEINNLVYKLSIFNLRLTYPFYTYKPYFS